MDFHELISDFAERHGIANLAAEDNAAALSDCRVGLPPCNHSDFGIIYGKQK